MTASLGIAAQRGLGGRPLILIAGLADVVEGQDRAPRTDSDPFHDPLVVGADVEIFEKLIADLVRWMVVAKPVQVEAHRESPEMRSPPSTRMIAPLIQADSGSESR